MTSTFQPSTRVFFYLLSTALLCTGLLSPLRADAQAQTGQTAAEEAVQATIDAQSFAGVAAGYSRGDVEWTGSAGLCNVEEKIPCTPQTRIRIASITKPMTAIAILQLHEKGLLDLDTPISTYLPTYPADKASRITTRQLLHHTSGIDGYGSAKEAQTTKQYDSLAAAAAVFQDRKLLFEPGSRYSYTTYGYVVLGMVIESVSGKSYEGFLQENIWQKAAMTDTAVEQFGQSYDNKAGLYQRNKKGQIKEAEANNLSNRVPGGGVCSTARDMLRFGRAVLDGTLISKQSLALLQTYPEVDRGKNNPYGMGFFHYGDNPKWGPIIGHTGEQTGAAGQLMLLPEANTVVIVLSNTSLALQQASELSVELIRAAVAAK